MPKDVLVLVLSKGGLRLNAKSGYIPKDQPLFILELTLLAYFNASGSGARRYISQ
jgi:hypothetical protein